MAVLCDGKSFSFYKFVNKHHAKGTPQIFSGEFPDGKSEIYIDDTSPKVSVLMSFTRDSAGHVRLSTTSSLVHTELVSGLTGNES